MPQSEDSTIAETETPPARKRRRRWVVWLVLLGVVALGIVAGLLISGIPQRAALPYLLGRVLGARVEVKTDQLFKAIRIDRMAAYDPSAPESIPPLFEVHGLTLDYDVPPVLGRYVNELTIDRLVLQPNASVSGQTNYGFLLRLWAAPPGATGRGIGLAPESLLPKNVLLKNLALDARVPSFALRFQGLHAQGRVESLEKMTLTLSGEPKEVAWSAGLPGGPMLGGPGHGVTGGRIAVDLSRVTDTLRARGTVSLPGLAMLQASTDVVMDGETLTADLALDRLELEQAFWGEWLTAHLPAPLRFDALKLADSRVAGVWSPEGLALSDAHVDVAVGGLVVGDPEHAFYEGPLRLEGSGNGNRWSFDAVLNQGQTLSFLIEGSLSEVSAEVSFADWTTGQLRAVIPEDYRGPMAWLPGLEGLSTTARGTWSAEAYTVNARLEPLLEAGGPAWFSVNGQGSPGVDGQAWFDGAVRAHLGQEEAAIKAHVRTPQDFDAQIDLDRFQPRTWLDAWTDLGLLDDIKTVVAGRVLLAAREQEPYHVDVALTVPHLQYADFTLPDTPPLSLSGTASVAQTGGHASGTLLEAAAGEAARIRLTDWIVETDPVQAMAGVSGTLDLEYVGALAGLPDLWGEVNLETSAVFKEKTGLQLPSVKLNAETVGYGEWSTPYGVPLVATATARVNPLATLVEAATIEARLGDHTVLTLARIELESPADETNAAIRLASVRLDTDLRPLVAKGYLQDAVGHASVECPAFEFSTNAPASILDCRIKAEQLALPGHLAAFNDLFFAALLHYGEAGKTGFGGSGQVRVEELSTAGLTLSGVQGDVYGRGNTIAVENLEVTLFGGKIQASAETGVLDPGLPIRIASKVQGLDLAVFTREFEPPAVRLTGWVSGAVAVDFDLNGLRDLEVALRATEGFTLNRDMVEQILLAQYMGDATGGKALDRVVQKVIGKDDQRPFDRARLDLGLEDNRITGQAVLESEGLNLTIAIKADPKALLEALKVRQRDAAAGPSA